MASVDTIIFDVGNTLRLVIPDAEFSAAAESELMALVGAKDAHDAFFEKLNANWNAYRKASKASLLEASETELWSQWLLPDYDRELICANAGRLTRLWRDHDGRREPTDDVVPTLRELYARGYTLAIIANTVTESEIPDWMTRDRVAGLFKTVILSSKVRLRKPDPEIYLLACRVLKKEPAQCVYIGDNPNRDVEGALRAGYDSMILIEHPGHKSKEKPHPEYAPSARITAMSGLLELFPPIGGADE